MRMHHCKVEEKRIVFVIPQETCYVINKRNGKVLLIIWLLDNVISVIQETFFWIGCFIVPLWIEQPVRIVTFSLFCEILISCTSAGENLKNPLYACNSVSTQH